MTTRQAELNIQQQQITELKNQIDSLSKTLEQQQRLTVDLQETTKAFSLEVKNEVNHLKTTLSNQQVILIAIQNDLKTIGNTQNPTNTSSLPTIIGSSPPVPSPTISQPQIIINTSQNISFPTNLRSFKKVLDFLQNIENLKNKNSNMDTKWYDILTSNINYNSLCHTTLQSLDSQTRSLNWTQAKPLLFQQLFGSITWSQTLVLSSCTRIPKDINYLNWLNNIHDFCLLTNLNINIYLSTILQTITSTNPQRYAPLTIYQDFIQLRSYFQRTNDHHGQTQGNNRHAPRQRNNNNNNYSPTNHQQSHTSDRKTCIHHPNSSSHTTAECKTKSSSSQPPSQNPNNNNHPPHQHQRTLPNNHNRASHQNRSHSVFQTSSNETQPASHLIPLSADQAEKIIQDEDGQLWIKK